MIPTYSYSIKNKLITDYLGSNLAVILINNINLGITDSPSLEQLEARRNFTAANLTSFEIGGTSLKGYRRHLINNSLITPNIISTNQTEAQLSAEFTAVGANMDPFSHIVVMRGANISGANPLTNGNNRGDTNGTIIFIEPVLNSSNNGQPLIIQEGVTFNYNFTLISATEIL